MARLRVVVGGWGMVAGYCLSDIRYSRLIRWIDTKSVHMADLGATPRNDRIKALTIGTLVTMTTATKTTTKATTKATATRAPSKSEQDATTAKLKASALVLARAYEVAGAHHATSQNDADKAREALASAETATGIVRVYMARAAYRLATHPGVHSTYNQARVRLHNERVKAGTQRDKKTGELVTEFLPDANQNGAEKLLKAGSGKTAFPLAFKAGQIINRAKGVSIDSEDFPTDKEVELASQPWKDEAKRKATERADKAEKAEKAEKADKAESKTVPTDSSLGDAISVAEVREMAKRFAEVADLLVQSGATVEQKDLDGVEDVLQTAMLALGGLVAE